jgi:hypothetical protein
VTFEEISVHNYSRQPLRCLSIILTTAIYLLATAQLAAQSPPNPNYVRQQIFDSYADFKSHLL